MIASEEWLEANGCNEPFSPQVYAELKAIFEAPLPPTPGVQGEQENATGGAS